MRHLITLSDLTSEELERIFAITTDLKAKFQRGVREPLFPGRVLALLFVKPSLRTRVSFEAAIAHLGGASLFLGADVGFGKRESLADFARVLSEYVDVLVVRTSEHATAASLAEHASCPVINGLTDEAHPCQALADLHTLRERLGPLAGRRLAFVGDGNNVARSLAVGCGLTGMKMVLAAPEKYQFSAEFVTRLRQRAPEMTLEVTTDPAAAVSEADAVYTDVWASMGQEQDREQRRRELAAYQVNAPLMAAAPAEAVFMHCLPARRGEEVTDDVIDGPQSIVVDQAANRLHAQKGILAWQLSAQA